MKPAFTCPHYLENELYCVLEIKRRNFDPQTTISLPDQWVYVDKQNLKISPLTLRSVDSSGEIQERFFDQGYLKFNGQNGTFIEKFNSAQHQLENKTGKDPAVEIQEAIILFLSK